MTRDDETGAGLEERRRARKPAGVARPRQPIKDRTSGLWRARYVDLDGEVRQSGRFERKGDAIAHTTTLVARLNRDGRPASRVPTLVRFLEEWPERFPRHPRTMATNRERIRRYLLPLLPEGGELPLDELRRADLRAAQDALLRRRLAKTTIDGAFSALSALLRDAVDIELIDANPAARLRVRPADPRLDPIRGAGRAARGPAGGDPRVHRRRAGPASRGVLGAAADRLPAGRAVRDAPRLARSPARADLPASDRRSLRQADGRPQGHPPHRRRGQTRPLDALPPPARRAARAVSGRGVGSPVPVAAREAVGDPQLLPQRLDPGPGPAPACSSRCTTCATRSRRGCWRPGSRSWRSRPGWGTRSAPAATRSPTPPRACTRTRPANGAPSRSPSSPHSCTRATLRTRSGAA